MQKITSKTKKVSVRLSQNVMPVHYAITLKPDLESHTFSGHETITISLLAPTKKIALHSKDLLIKNVSVIFGKNNISPKNISYDNHLETATFEFDTMLKKGKVKLSISFEGVLADNMRGFYKSKYVLGGAERVMAATQFEATDARRAFPCFDEPTHKAVFDVNLVIPGSKMAISNTLPTSIIEHEAGHKIVSFASTPKMSTYLLAFIVGDFEWVEKTTKNNVLVRVLTVPGKSHQAHFALDVTVRCLEFYEEYFDIAYPLNTLDMIAIPDFSSLAMENWGAITFREIGLLFDEGNTSTSYRQMVALVIAHELAHQWFGNLVTMEWWTHLWLNEGFATYIEHLAVAELFPEYNAWQQFVVATSGHGLGNALKLDALANTHPIEVEVHHPDEIGEIFDVVSYDKGSSVIRMLAEYLGEKDFRDGLRHYLKKHSYKNASTVHLWESFEKVSKKPVRKIMSTWTGKAGYPMLSVEVSGKNLVLSQKRYYSSITQAKKSKDKTIWPIPLSIVTEKGEIKLPLMSKKLLKLPLPKEGWFKFNAHEGSVYRTQYDKAAIAMLQTPLAGGLLLAEDRLGLIRDAFSFAESGNAPTVTVLEMARLYTGESEYVVWIEILSGFRYIANLLYGTKSYELFRSYARDILSGAVARVGWEAQAGEPDNTALLRSLILGAASFYGDTTVIMTAKEKFENIKEIKINPDLRGVVYATLAREGGEMEYEALLSMYRTETLHEEKNRLLLALGQFKIKKLIARTLELGMSDEVRMQDRNGAFAGVLSNPYGRNIGWAFLKKNWKKIGEAYGEGNHLLSRLIAVLNRNTTMEAYKDIQAFFKMHHAPSAERTIQQTLEHIDSNIKWLARDEQKIAQWLRNYKK